MFLRKEFICIYLLAIQSTWSFYRSTSNVTSLTSEDFYQNVPVDRIWVVQFYSYKSKECQNFEKEFSVSASILKNVVKFGAVNVENNTELVKDFGVDVKSLPLIKIFGIVDGEAITYNGSKTSKDLVDTILTSILEKIKTQFGEILPENLVTELTDKNFDQIITKSQDAWLVQFYAPWCLHCKEFKAIWEQAAVYLKGKIKLASLDATANKLKAKENDIRAYPTVKLFPPGQKSQKLAKNYENERSVTGIVNWVLETLPGPDVVQLTNKDVFEEGCLSRNLCVISLLPDLLDCKADCRRNYLEMLKMLGEEHKRYDWGWLWSEGTVQKDMEDLFGVEGFGYPSMIVFNPRKRKYTVFKGSFAKNDINEFLIHLAKVNANSIDDDIIDKIVDAEVWNGGEYEDMSMEYELKDEL